MIDEHQETPIAEAKSLSELNIHLGYIRQTISENRTQNRANFQEIKEQIALQAHSFVLQDEFKPFMKDVEELRATQKTLVEFKDTLTGKMWGVGIMVGAIAGLISFLANKFI